VPKLIATDVGGGCEGNEQKCLQTFVTNMKLKFETVPASKK
jgi:hypothetical protein